MMNSNGLARRKSFRHLKHRTGTVAWQRGFVAQRILVLTLLTCTIYFRLSGCRSSLLLIWFRDGLNTAAVITAPKCRRTSPAQQSPLRQKKVTVVRERCLYGEVGVSYDYFFVEPATCLLWYFASRHSLSVVCRQFYAYCSGINGA